MCVPLSVPALHDADKRAQLDPSPRTVIVAFGSRRAWTARSAAHHATHVDSIESCAGKEELSDDSPAQVGEIRLFVGRCCVKVRLLAWKNRLR